MESEPVKVLERMRTIAPMDGETTVAEATAVMEEEGVNVVPIGNGEQIAGTISTQDIALAASKEARDISQAGVQDILEPVIGFCGEEDSLGKAVETMQKRGLPTLLVRNAEGSVTGTLSLTDVFLDESCGEDALNQGEDSPVRPS